MITKNQLKYYSSLLNKKHRILENKFIAEGIKIVEEGLESDYECETIFVTSKFEELNPRMIKKLKARNINLEVLKSVEFQRISDTKAPQGIAAVFQYKQNKIALNKIDDNLIVYLEGLADPGNLGTIIRTADWFGIKTMMLSEETVELYNPKVIRSSMGSIFHLEVFDDVGLNELKIFKAKDYKFVCSNLTGTSIYDFEKPDKFILFFCNEANGPSEKLLKLADEKITIPGKGRAESLNVSTAAAIILSELTK